MDPTQQDKLDALLDDFYFALDEHDLAKAKDVLADAERLDAHGAEVLYAKAQVAWIDEDADEARRIYGEIVSKDPEAADAWHALGMLADEAGDEEAMVRAFLEVHRLDSAADALESPVTPELEALITKVAREVLDNIPEPFASRLGNVPVVLEARPSLALVKEGFDPRALGLFEGNDDEAQRAIDVAATPTRVVLYTANLVDAFQDEEELQEEVEVTILHELGHFFGLEEDELESLGLE
jgi:predicted Zn-dependent protease with MMP-like domain